MYKAKHFSPVIPSFNLRKTVSFFTDLLHFKALRYEASYTILYKDNTTVHIQRAGTDIVEMAVYLEVNDIENVWSNIKEKLHGIEFREPFDQVYGMREIHVLIPETKTLMFIGQAVV